MTVFGCLRQSQISAVLVLSQTNNLYFIQLQLLDLSGINLGDSGFELVATCVHKIKELFIGSEDDEDLTLDGVKALVESVKNSPPGVSFIKKTYYSVQVST